MSNLTIWIEVEIEDAYHRLLPEIERGSHLHFSFPMGNCDADAEILKHENGYSYFQGGHGCGNNHYELQSAEEALERLLNWNTGWNTNEGKTPFHFTKNKQN